MWLPPHRPQEPTLTVNPDALAELICERTRAIRVPAEIRQELIEFLKERGT
jgi:hypothetical protein